MDERLLGKSVSGSGSLAGSGETVELRVPCKAEYVRTVRMLVSEIADSVPLSPEAIDEVKIAASEAVANIVRHAYNDAAQPEPVLIRCSGACGKLTIEVIDRGVGFEVPEPVARPALNTTKEGGLGIFLIRNLMDSVDYWSRPSLGTRITMVKRRGRRSGAGSRKSDL